MSPRFLRESLRADHAQFGGASGVPCSQQLRDTTGPRVQISMQIAGLTVSRGGPNTAWRAVSPPFHT
jgi:hypothetical protein